MNRCYSPNNPFFADYGGRDIFVCKEWEDGPAEFIKWCEEHFQKGKSLDRIDNNASYSPANCKFVSPAEQNRNMRSNVWVDYNGERLIFKDFVAKYGVVNYEQAKGRIKLGWDNVTAALTPLHQKPAL